LFLVEGTQMSPVYLVTTNGKNPDENSKILHDGYLNIHKRQDAKYKARSGDYTETDILLTDFRSFRVKDLIDKLK
jgi:hypothetical protein